MDNSFFEQPILNSPYAYPGRHWELDGTGQPTQQILERRRRAEFITPIPQPKKRKGSKQQALALDAEDEQRPGYNLTKVINRVRDEVDRWRAIEDPTKWHVTYETQLLLQHWRTHKFSNVRPFFCQIEAVETVIWLTEVAPQHAGAVGRDLLDYLKRASDEHNPGLERLALKLATGAGKTMVMALLIAWQTINAVRHPGSKRFTRGFLIVAPGITIKDRLRVLQPNDPNSYYRERELVPAELMPEIDKAKIVITNYHAFMLRERMDISKGGRQLLQGRGGEALSTKETEGQMIQRVMPELMGLKDILVINDEAHHCYQEKLATKDADDDPALKGEEKQEAEANNETARVWINGLRMVERKLGLTRVIDLSATPFFLSGSGHGEGKLFPWTMSDFSLMDAIECGIVKLPRVPVADNLNSGDMPMYRELWKHIGPKMPKKKRGGSEKSLDPLNLPTELQNALDALYGHYAKTFAAWQEANIQTPPCFIVVCNNTATSKLVYDYISGFWQEDEAGNARLHNGRLELFRNFDEYDRPLARPRTILIDSAQLESGEALDKNFREMASTEIEQFRREMQQRTGDLQLAENLTDQDLCAR